MRFGMLCGKCLLRTCSDSVVVIVASTTLHTAQTVGLSFSADVECAILMMGSEIMVIIILKETGEHATTEKKRKRMRNKRIKCQRKIIYQQK